MSYMNGGVRSNGIAWLNQKKEEKKKQFIQPDQCPEIFFPSQLKANKSGKERETHANSTHKSHHSPPKKRSPIQDNSPNSENQPQIIRLDSPSPSEAPTPTCAFTIPCLNHQPVKKIVLEELSTPKKRSNETIVDKPKKKYANLFSGLSQEDQIRTLTLEVNKEKNKNENISARLQTLEIQNSKLESKLSDIESTSNSHLEARIVAERRYEEIEGDLKSTQKKPKKRRLTFEENSENAEKSQIDNLSEQLETLNTEKTVLEQKVKELEEKAASSFTLPNEQVRAQWVQTNRIKIAHELMKQISPKMKALTENLEERDKTILDLRAEMEKSTQQKDDQILNLSTIVGNLETTKIELETQLEIEKQNTRNVLERITNCQKVVEEQTAKLNKQDGETQKLLQNISKVEQENAQLRLDKDEVDDLFMAIKMETDKLKNDMAEATSICNEAVSLRQENVELKAKLQKLTEKSNILEDNVEVLRNMVMKERAEKDAWIGKCIILSADLPDQGQEAEKTKQRKPRKRVSNEISCTPPQTPQDISPNRQVALNQPMQVISQQQFNHLMNQNPHYYQQTLARYHQQQQMMVNGGYIMNANGQPIPIQANYQPFQQSYNPQCQVHYEQSCQPTNFNQIPIGPQQFPIGPQQFPIGLQQNRQMPINNFQQFSQPTATAKIQNINPLSLRDQQQMVPLNHNQAMIAQQRVRIETSTTISSEQGFQSNSEA